MELWLIRHGQSANNALEQQAGDPSGRLPDPPLTALGHEQARRLAGWAAQGDGGPVTHLYSSLTTRAVQTAAPLAGVLGLPVRGLAAAYECGGLTAVVTEVAVKPRNFRDPSKASNLENSGVQWS